MGDLLERGPVRGQVDMAVTPGMDVQLMPRDPVGNPVHFLVRQETHLDLRVLQVPTVDARPIARVPYKTVLKGLDPAELDHLHGIDGPIVVTVDPDTGASARVLGAFSEATASTIILSSEEESER